MARHLTGGAQLKQAQHRFPVALLADVSTRQDLSARGLPVQEAEEIQISLIVSCKPILMWPSPLADGLIET